MRHSRVVLLAGLAACTPAPSTAPVPARAPALPFEIHWFRNSAEQRAAYRQGYLLAEERVRELAPAAGGAWAVIMDADETIIDNSTYQQRQARLGLGYEAESWHAWARERAATALPGAVEFTRAVRALGGRVVIVTNRDQVVCDDTRANLQALAVAADLVLCRQDVSDKNPRFQAVAAGTGGLPPLRVLMWVGDNIQDFPGMTQEARNTPAALSEFGRTWIILPNPMYGSWERNPAR